MLLDYYRSRKHVDEIRSGPKAQLARGGGEGSRNKLIAGDNLDVLRVLRDDPAKVHAIKLIAAEDQHVLEVVIEEVKQVLANSVRSSLIPRGITQRLFRGQDFHKATGEMIELIRLRDVPMQRCRVE